MRYIVIVLLSILYFSCEKNTATNKKQSKNVITSVTIEPIFDDSISIRAIAVTPNNDLIYGGNKTTIGYYDAKRNSYVSILQDKVPDSLHISFRATAYANKDIFAISIVNPALLYKISIDGEVSLVYKEEHEKVFYDAMAFWNDTEGIAIGDPTDDCMSMIITRDGGNTWQKIACENLPKAKEGEAAFAASNTNIVTKGNETWVATGGKSSRILYSADKGRTWTVYNTPIIQGKETTGIYSLAFYDAKNGFAIGGDYTKADENKNNKIKTTDGGKTWKVVANNTGPGYRSCVQYIPNSDAKELVVVGFKGIDYSNDAGHTWTHLSNEEFYTIRFVNDSTAYAAGKNRIARLKFQ